ncbi:hypothetical protein [Nocardia yunnanensis]|uniref:hypothetical protein n=1 Tax=Nocardia yunnanensis TaxID=2382165 RepID=UPI0013C47915|nr:hypothetical protein [Nocardia yunnanensis]
MIAHWRATVQTAAQYTAVTTAGLAIMMPINYGWFELAPYKVDVMVREVPRAMESGAMIAVVTAALVIAAGSGRAAWFLVLVALLGMLANHTVLPFEVDSLTSMNYIDSLLAGVLIGALAPVAWTRSATTGVYLFGCLSAAILGDIVQRPTDGHAANPLERLLGGAPPIWPILTALVLVGLCVVVRAVDVSVAEIDHRFPLRKVLSGGVLISSVATMSRWLAEDGDRPPVVVSAVILTVVGCTVAAFLLPERDGVAVLLLVAFAGTSSAVVTIPRPWWADLLAFVAVGVGMVAAQRWPLQSAAIGLSVGMAATAVLLALKTAPNPTASTLGVGCIGLTGGYSAAVAAPPRAASAVVALTALFVPSAAVALRGRSFDQVAYSSQWYRFAPDTHDAVPALAALGLALGTGAAICLLRRLRRPKNGKSDSYR